MRWFQILITSFIFLALTSGCKKDDEILVLDQMHYFTTDIDLFWEFYDGSNLNNLTSVSVRNNYINKGTVGLKDYAIQKDLSGTLSNILGTTAYQNYYNSIRANTIDLQSIINRVNQGVEALAGFYPQIRYTNVYFLIGGLSAGGRISENGLLIAAEMFTKSANTPTNGLSPWLQNVTREKEYLPSIVLHELAHFQQNFRARNGNLITVLEQSIREGMADYIAKYLLGDDPFTNNHLHEYGDPREAEIWQEFSLEVNKAFSETEWLYTGTTTQKGHPADMGYYVGFKILEAFAANYSNEEEAILAMLQAEDYLEIFNQSGYNGG